MNLSERSVDKELFSGVSTKGNTTIFKILKLLFKYIIIKQFEDSSFSTYKSSIFFI